MTRRAVGKRVGVLGRLLAGHKRPIGELDAPDPLHVRAALPPRHEQPRRIALLGTEWLAILAVRDHGVVPGLGDRDAARQHRRVSAFGQEPCGAGLHPHLAEQGGERDARPFAGAGEAIDQLGRHVGAQIAIGGPAVPRAFEKVQPRHGGEPSQRLEIEDRRPIDHAVDQQLVAVGIDAGDARVVTLVVQVRWCHDPAQVLERGERRPLVPPTHHPPRPLEGRAPPEVGERPARQFRRIGRHLDLRESSAAQHRNADRARGAPEQPPARNPHGIHDTPPLADPLGIQAGRPTRNQRPRSTDQLTSPRSNREPAPAPATAARPAAATAR